MSGSRSCCDQCLHSLVGTGESDWSVWRIHWKLRRSCSSCSQVHPDRPSLPNSGRGTKASTRKQVRLCTSLFPSAWFGLLSLQSMTSNNGSARTKYTFEGAYCLFGLLWKCKIIVRLIAVCPFTALLYKPLDRVTKTTLVLRVRKPLIISWIISAAFLFANNA